MSYYKKSTIYKQGMISTKCRESSIFTVNVFQRLLMMNRYG